MAERNVSVKLSANVSQYLAAMAKAKAATSGLATDSARSMTQLGGAMQSVGRTATIGVTVPLLALGAGAVSMAAKFDTAFAQMVGLANVPAAEVDALKESVLALAGETAVAPQELAEGLYFAASAGLDSAAAMEVLEMAARASAAGMGSTADVVNLVTGAIAAYGEDNITAAGATDILTAAIREGKAEPTEMADALGRVTPIAAQMGIGFDEVAGATAYMSTVLGDTDETVTALRGALLAMMDPSVQGKDALESMGTSAGELQAAIASDGLLGALELLREHGFNENSVAMSDLFEDNRALVGATILLNDESGRLNGTLEATATATGSAGDAFSAVADTDGFKMKQAITDIKVAMIQVGEILLPIAADIASAISGLIGWFTELNPTVQTVVGAFVGLAAAAGPVVFIAGSLIKNFQAIQGVMKGSTGAMTTASKAMLGVGAALAVGFIAYQAFTAEQKKTDEITRVTSQGLLGQFSALFAVAEAAGHTAGEIDAVTLANEALSLALGEGTEGLTTALGAFNMDAENLMTILAQMDQAPVTALDNLARSFGFTAEQADALSHVNFDAFGVWRQNADYLAESVGVAEEDFLAFGNAVMELQNQFDNVDVQAIAKDFLDAQVGVSGYGDSLVEAAEQQAGQTRQTGDAVAVLYAWTQQLATADETTRDAVLASDEYQGALAALPPELQALIEGTEGAAGATDELADRQASSIDTMSDLAQSYEDAATEVGIYRDALDRALGPSGQWIRAHDGFASALLGFNDTLDDSSDSLDYNTEAGLANRSAVMDLADELVTLTESNIDSGMSQRDVTDEYLKGRSALIEAAAAAGLNRGEVIALLDTYGLAPDLITTTMNIAGDALDQWRLQRYLDTLDEIPADIATEIETLIDEGKRDEAIAMLDFFETNTWDAWIVVHADTEAARQSIASVQRAAGGGSGGGGWGGWRATGGYFDSPTVIGVAESGKEVLLPLEDPGRMAALLGMSEVGPRVAAAFGNLMPAPQTAPPPAPSSAAAGGGGIHIEGGVHVGSRQDLPDLNNELGRVNFLSQYAYAGSRG